MIMADNSGIYCDICGSEMRGQFIYYSCITDKLEVDMSDKQAPYKDHDKRHLDIDICDKCMEEIKTKMKVVIKTRERKVAKDTKNKANQWSMDNASVRPKKGSARR